MIKNWKIFNESFEISQDKIKDYIFSHKLPKNILFNGEKYIGDANYINGYNGYTRTVDDGLLCALIDNSLWDSNRKPNLLTDEDGFYIKISQYGGSGLFIK